MKRFRRFGDLPSSESDDSDWTLCSDSELEHTSAHSQCGKRPKQRGVASKNGTGKRRKYVYARELFHQEHNNGRDLWGDIIPAELLAIIFRLVIGVDSAVPVLLRLGHVCSLWRRVSLLPKLWRRVSLVDLRRLTNEEFVRLCSHQLKHSKSLEISACHKLREEGYMAMADNCQRLQQLSVSKVSSYFTAASLDAVSRNLDQLQCLSLVDLRGGVNSRSLAKMVEMRGSQLTVLSLSGSGGVGLALIRSIACRCCELTHLDLSSTPLRSLPIDDLQRGCPHLRALHLDHLGITSSHRSKEEALGFEELHILTVANSTLSPAVQTVTLLLHNSLQLHTLDLRAWCDPVYNSLTRALPANISDLHHLLVARWKYVNITDFMTAISIYRQLVELDLSYCPGINDDAVSFLAQTPVALSLTTLDLSSTQITAAGLRTVVAACPHLTSINLTGCRGVPRGLKQKHDKGSLQLLRKSLLDSNSR